MTINDYKTIHLFILQNSANILSWEVFWKVISDMKGCESMGDLLTPKQVYPYKQIIIIYLIIRYIFEQYINVRQFNRTMITDMPHNLIRLNIKKQQFLLSQAYSNDKITFQMLSLSIRTCLECLIIMANVRPFIWDNVDEIIPFVDLGNEFQRSLGYWLVYAFISKAFMVPFELYELVIIQRKHKRQSKTISDYLFDLGVEGFFFLVSAIPVIYGYLRIVQIGGQYFYLFLQVLIVVATVIYAKIFPFVTVYFNKFKSIKNQDLKLKIKHLTTKTRFPGGDIKIKVSKLGENSSHGAEYMGIGKSHFIAIYQSLLMQLKHDQIIAVLAHQIGHWYNWHSLKSLVVSLIQNIAVFYMYSSFMHNESILLSFGFRQKSIFMGTALFYELLTPLTAVFYYWNLSMKRYFQFESDSFAVSLGHGEELKTALLKFYIDSAPMIKPDYLYSWAHLTHPTLHERIEYIDYLINKQAAAYERWLDER